MKIVADENITQLAEYFGGTGELVSLPGRAIDAVAVRDADALLVRSITRVDANLLSASRCRFVGTATSGIDHIDTAWLASRNIGLGWAQGCNARAVVEYVLGVMAQLSVTHGFDWRRCSFGIVGCGAIGSLLARQLLALDIVCVIHDPFLDAGHPLASHFGSLEDALNQDVLTLHTPLTREGPWPTQHLLNADTLARLKPAAILINAARGEVVANLALLDLLQRHPQRVVVLDAWEGEPSINLDLLQKVTLGTPHIAGYSTEGKLNGTRMIAAAYCTHFGLAPPPILTTSNTSAGALLQVESGLSALQQLNALILKAYDVTQDHRAMQGLLASAAPAVLFDRLRKKYPERREFSHFRVDPEGLTAEACTQAQALGFALAR